MFERIPMICVYLQMLRQGLSMEGFIEPCGFKGRWLPHQQIDLKRINIDWLLLKFFDT